MKDLLYALTVDQGFCCIRMFFARTRRYRTGLLAAFLGVDKRTVRRWRHGNKERPYLCEKCKGCQRNVDLPHPLDDVNIVRRYTGKGRDSDG
jgi:hypothetical protein